MKVSSLSNDITNDINLVATQEHRSSIKNISALAIAMCGLSAIFYCYEYYLRVAPSVMSAELKASFLLSDAAFGHLAAFFYYAYTPMQIPVGMLMDKFGPRRILTIACVFCVLGTYLFASTQIILLAQIGRFMVGFGSAFAYVGVLKISNDWLPPKYYAFMAGFTTALGMAGAMSGELTMASMVSTVGWQATLMYSVYVGIALTFILWFVLKDKQHKPGHSLQKNNVSSEIHNKTILKNKNDTIGIFQGLKEMSKSRTMWINGLIGCLTFLPLSAFAELWAVPFLQAVGFSKPDAAMGSSMIFLGFALGGPCFGVLSEMIKSRRIPLLLGSFISAFFLFLVILLPNTSKLWMYSLLFLSSFFASVEILVFAVSNDINRKEVSGTAAAFTNMVVMLGGVVLPPLIGKLLDNSQVLSTTTGLSSVGSDSYGAALIVLPMALVLAGLLSIWLRESYKRE